MIQINLNLLSPQQKRELKIKRIYITIKEMVMLVLLFTCISAILLLVSRYFLEEQLAMLMDKNATAIRVGEEINKKVIIINEKINNAYSIQQKFRHWSRLMIVIAEITPNNIAYNSIKIYPEKSMIELQGIAKSRQALIDFKERIGKNEFFSEIDLPLTDLLARENNSFTIRANIKLEN